MVRTYIVGALILVVPTVAIAGKNKLPERLQQYTGPSQEVLAELNNLDGSNNPSKPTDQGLSLSEIGNTDTPNRKRKRSDQNNNQPEQNQPLTKKEIKDLLRIIEMQKLAHKFMKLRK